MSQFIVAAKSTLTHANIAFFSYLHVLYNAIPIRVILPWSFKQRSPTNNSIAKLPVVQYYQYRSVLWMWITRIGHKCTFDKLPTFSEFRQTQWTQNWCKLLIWVISFHVTAMVHMDGRRKLDTIPLSRRRWPLWALADSLFQVLRVERLSVFTARRRMHTHGLAVDICPSVRLSVCQIRELCDKTK